MADFLWPRECMCEGCHHTPARKNSYICDDCRMNLPWLERKGRCKVCGAVSKADSLDFVCDACREDPPAFEFARSAMRFAEPIRRLILDYKFSNATQLAGDLADMTEDAVRAGLDFGAIDVVVPVPLHPNRLSERGYNQSALIAENLAKNLNRRYDGKSLKRIADTEHQARLGGKERRKNLNGAFAASTPFIRSRTVLLVDDVMTTGTTLSACAKALRKAGAARVWCATVARA